ncbi:hypothetical protein CDAR_575431 [Caerostris darwini]|uniref:Uncharacterized protein n=1 Tax=Caerostris darwini TaxID=1538125 RepID=A0AAV4TRW1_9ARAC|nr:hypothetical protein CDAR_575431 [Caerostris darwini]
MDFLAFAYHMETTRQPTELHGQKLNVMLSEVLNEIQEKTAVNYQNAAIVSQRNVYSFQRSIPQIQFSLTLELIVRLRSPVTLETING